MQPKLLRVLQDQEFERLGGLQTLKVNFRLIAATNRNLAEAMRDNEFRSDLYYRLNVFPIRIPPLRERRQDIRCWWNICAEVLLAHEEVDHQHSAESDGRAQALDWPGNVRELENIIERAVILTQGSVLVVPLSEPIPLKEERSKGQTLEAAERRPHRSRAAREPWSGRRDEWGGRPARDETNHVAIEDETPGNRSPFRATASIRSASAPASANWSAPSHHQNQGGELQFSQILYVRCTHTVVY